MSQKNNTRQTSPHDIQPDDALALVTQAAFLCNAHEQILLLQLPDGRWQLPGGKVKHNEQWEAGLRREILEETGITDLEIHQPIYVDNWHTPTQNYYRTYFLCTTLANNITLSDAHDAYQWITDKQDLSSYVFTHDTVREHIATFFSDCR